MLIHELLNEDLDIVPNNAPLIVLDSKSAMSMAKNGKDTKHTRHIARRINSVRNGENARCTKLIGVKEVCSWQTMIPGMLVNLI